MQCVRAGGEPAVGGVRANRRRPKEQQSSQWRVVGRLCEDGETLEKLG